MSELKIVDLKFFSISVLIFIYFLILNLRLRVSIMSHVIVTNCHDITWYHIYIMYYIKEHRIFQNNNVILHVF